jgi:DNA-binding IclR family transcriptional regulator
MAMTNVPAAANALDVLLLLGRRAAPAPAAAIAQELGLPRSTVYHLLRVLQDKGFVVRLPDESRYGLGMAAVELGSAYSRQEPLRWIARTVLTSLVSKTGHNGHFATLDGRDVLYLLEERHAGRPSLITDVGVRLPAQLTASGCAMLSLLPESQVRALWPSRHDLTRRNESGPSTLTELRALLAEARRRGYAIENGSITTGFASVAAPVVDHKRFPVAAVTLTFPFDEAGEAETQILGAEVINAAAMIARQIGGRPNPSFASTVAPRI